MKKDAHLQQNLLHYLLHNRRILLRAAAAVLIFSLGYALGFLCAPTPASPAPPVLASSSDLPFSSSDDDDRELLPTSRSSHRSCHGSANKGRDGQQSLPPQPRAVEVKPTTTLTTTTQPAVVHDLFRFRTRCAPPLPLAEIMPTLLDRVYNGTSPYAGFPPPHAARLLRPKRLHGWGSTAPVFRALIESVRPRVIVEVGTFLGSSALHMANLTSDLGTLILCLDDFRGWPGFRRLHPPKADLFRDMADVNGDVTLMYQFMQNVVASGEEGRVLPVPSSTASGLAALCDWGVYADLVEVDAGHDFHSAWQDINMAWAIVRPGGVMFGHDYRTSADDHGVRRAVDLFAKTKGLRVQPSGQHWVLYPAKTR